MIACRRAAVQYLRTTQTAKGAERRKINKIKQKGEEMILVWASHKGGVGKSTMCVQAATSRALEGKNVLMVYCDTQPGGAASWHHKRSTRKEKGEAIAPIVDCELLFGDNTARRLHQLRERYDDVFVDVGGGDTAEMRGAISVADLIISPINCGQFDVDSVRAMDATIKIARAWNSDVRARVLINCLSPNKERRERREREIRTSLGPLLKHIDGFYATAIQERSVFEEVAETGLTVHEFGRNKIARAEFDRFYKEIFE
jgi:chromosome partitioning protein